MRTLDEQNALAFSLRSRALRNIKLLVRIASMLKGYFTTGAAIRRRYREKEKRGEVYYVDGNRLGG